MTEDQLEQETLTWLQDVGYTHLYGPDIAQDGPHPERADSTVATGPFDDQMPSQHGWRPVDV